MTNPLSLKTNRPLLQFVRSLFLFALFFNACSRTNRSVSSVELFQKISPSVFVVQALDENGKPSMLGSGVALASDFLITNCHVVQSGSFFKVNHGKDSWDARLVQAMPDHDLCGLRPSNLRLHPVEIRLSSKLATGERVYAVGSPEGLELTFSEGVISGLRENEGVRMIQTSAAISPGSSGGGLFDAQGILVGITTFYLKEGQSLNFALPGEWISSLKDKLNATSQKTPLSTDPEIESAAWLCIGQQAVKDENYDLAMHSFNKSGELKVGDAVQARIEVGRLWMQAWSSQPSGKYKNWLCTQLSCDPQSWSLEKAVISEAQQNAITAYESAIQIEPSNAEAWFGLANSHAAKNDYKQAISSAKEATRLAPDDFRYWLFLGSFYVETKSYVEAEDALQRGEKLIPAGKKWFLYFAGMQYAAIGDRKQVMRIYQELRATDPEGADRFFKEYVVPRSNQSPSK